MPNAWTTAAALADLGVGERIVLKSDRQQVVVLRLAEDRFAAVDNLCPHEGYPLAQGIVKDCVLTCAWHNFKFDLATGACLQGDEDVRVHPVRVHDGLVQVQLQTRRTAPPERLWQSLTAGLVERKLGRVARDVVRLLHDGTPPEQLLLHAATEDAARAEYGCTHTLPVAADALRWLPRYPGLRAALPVAQAMELCAEACVGRAPRPAAGAVDPGADPGAVEHRLHELVEAEETTAAEAVLRGALEHGCDAATAQRWLLGLCTDHFLSFGHPLIYTVKAFDLIAAAGWPAGRQLLPGLLLRIASSTREDTLPPMRHVTARQDAARDRLPAWRRQTGATDPQPLLDALLHGDKQAPLDALQRAFEAGAGPRAVLDVISRAAAERLLRFGPAIDLSVAVQEGWLDVTHALTFANACRRALERDPAPRALRSVFYAAHFVHRNRALDGSTERRVAAPGGDPVAATLAAVGQRDAGAALAAARAALAGPDGGSALLHALQDCALDDPATRPIVVAHVIKMVVASFEESEAIGRPEPVLALVRLLSSPRRERPTTQLVHEAIRFVGDGKPPRRLT